MHKLSLFNPTRDIIDLHDRRLTWKTIVNSDKKSCGKVTKLSGESTYSDIRELRPEEGTVNMLYRHSYR